MGKITQVGVMALVVAASLAYSGVGETRNWTVRRQNPFDLSLINTPVNVTVGNATFTASGASCRTDTEMCGVYDRRGGRTVYREVPRSSVEVADSMPPNRTERVGSMPPNRTERVGSMPQNRTERVGSMPPN